MKGDYPRWKVTYLHEELIEHFLLSTAEHELIKQCRGDVNRHAVAVLLKALPYLGYFMNTSTLMAFLNSISINHRSWRRRDG